MRKLTLTVIVAVVGVVGIFTTFANAGCTDSRLASVRDSILDSCRAASTNGNKAAIDFVSEDDVRQAIQKGEKIYINAKTIITPAARDLGEPAEVFAKV